MSSRPLTRAIFNEYAPTEGDRSEIGGNRSCRGNYYEEKWSECSPRHFVRAKASSAHRIPVGPSSVRAKASSTHRIPAWSSFVRDQACFARGIQRLKRGKN